MTALGPLTHIHPQSWEHGSQCELWLVRQPGSWRSRSRSGRIDAGPTVLSRLLGLVEKRREHFWSLHGKDPHVQSKILVTQGPRTCLRPEAAGQQTGLLTCSLGSTRAYHGVVDRITAPKDLAIPGPVPPVSFYGQTSLRRCEPASRRNADPPTP
ncbi:uncharacterized protein LOC144613157 isoform X1 [Panthera onca]